MMNSKRFAEWFELKQRLDSLENKPPLVSEGEIWWASVGQNIGYEIHGKSTKFSRPVIIYKKLSRNLFLVIPTTTQFREGNWFASFTQGGKNHIACIHQVRTIDYRRLWSRLGSLDDIDFENVKSGFMNLYI